MFLVSDGYSVRIVNRVSQKTIYLHPNKKKDETQGVRCHVKTMMNMEACESQRYDEYGSL